MPIDSYASPAVAAANACAEPSSNQYGHKSRQIQITKKHKTTHNRVVLNQKRVAANRRIKKNAGIIKLMFI